MAAMIHQHDNEQGSGSLLQPSRLIVALCWGVVGIYLSALQVRDVLRALLDKLKRIKRK
jgi:hypothetical protein